MINREIQNKCVVIVNPIAGGKNPLKVLRQLKKKFQENSDFGYTIHYSKGPKHIKKIAQDHLNSEYNIYVVVGGDGSINEVASVTIGRQVALAIIPTGSGNGLYNSIYGRQDYKKAIERVFTFSKTHQINAGTINGNLFFNVSGIGFDGFIAKMFNKGKKRGLWSYISLISKYFNSYSSHVYKIQIENVEFEGSYFMISIANGSDMGNQCVINTNANMSDDKIELCLVSKPKLVEVPDILLKIIRKNYDWSKYVACVSVKTCTIFTAKPVHFHLDGNYIDGHINTYTIAVKKEKLTVIAD